MAFIDDIRELRKEYAGLELALKNEDEAHRLQAKVTRPVFLRVPAALLQSIEQKAKEDGRSRQNYILKVLSDRIGKDSRR